VRPSFRLGAAALVTALLSACSAPSNNTEAPASMPPATMSPPLAMCDRDSAYTCPANVLQVGPHAVRCRQPYRDALSPASYSVSDLGEPGVPQLTTQQVALIRLIGKYVHSDTIRFAIVQPVPYIGSFFVFDAKYGPCPSGVEYWVLNDGHKASNLYYDPRTGHEFAGPGDVAPSPGPWCKPRAGVEPCFLVNSYERETVAHPIPIARNCGNPPRCTPEVPVGRYGIACIPFEGPSPPGTASFSVADAGKQGVVKLSPSQFRLVRLMQHFIRSSTLRFAVGPFGPWGRPALIVFDATEGPCYAGALGYFVLNDADGNTFYQPGEAADHIHAGPGDIRASPGPWCRRRLGVAPCD
jgi:hypothetical protein